MAAPLARVSEVRARDVHRLVPSRFSDESVLARLTSDVSDLQALFELDAATNARLVAEKVGLTGIGPDELLAGVPYAHIVNAAFCHPHPEGSRFNGPDRGAWYAALAVETSQAEVAFHKQVQLDEIGWTMREEVTYDDYLADVSANLHDLRARQAPGRMPGARLVRGQSATGRATAGRRVARRGVPERAARRWHVRGLLPPGHRHPRAP